MLKSIRAFDRGLAVLEHLDRRESATLADLAQATGLPKATLLRLLKTLIERGWAYRRVNDGRYGLAVAPGGRDPGGVERTRIARAGDPFLRRLTEITGFAADLTAFVQAGALQPGVLEPGVLEVVESTRRRMQGGVDPLVAGFRPSLVFSSPGRALLAASGEASRQRHIEHILRTDSPAERFFVTSGALAREIRRTSERGYAIRERGYWPDSSDYGEEPMDIAVPIGGRNDPVGCLSIVWPASRDRPENVAALHLENLRRIASELTRAISPKGAARLT